MRDAARYANVVYLTLSTHYTSLRTGIDGAALAVDNTSVGGMAACTYTASAPSTTASFEDALAMALALVAVVASASALVAVAAMALVAVVPTAFLVVVAMAFLVVVATAFLVLPIHPLLQAFAIFSGFHLAHILFELV